jgi:hypothetical protein
MKGDALLNLCKYAKNFSLEKSLNPFSYFTQIISNCFRHRLQLEKTRLLQYEKYKNLQDFNIYEVTPGENLQAYSYIENNNTNYNASNQHYVKEEPEKEKKANKIRMPKNHIGDFFK